MSQWDSMFTEVCPIPFFSCNLYGKRIDANPAFWQNTGLVQGEAGIDISIWQYIISDQTERQEFLNYITQQDEIHDYKICITRDPKDKLFFRLTGRMVNSDDHLPRFHGFLEDLTRQYHLEDQLLRASSWKTLGKMSGGIIHDLNNLHSVIEGCAALMNHDMDKNQQGYEDLQTVLKVSQRASELTNRLLMVVKRNRGSESKKTNVQNTLMNQLSVLPFIMGHTIRLTTDLHTPQGLIEMDEYTFEQIIYNICMNAKAAMPDVGELNIRSRIVSISDSCTEQKNPRPGEYIMLSITDNGIGMDEETQKNIFNPFFTTKGEDKGSGMGLSLTCEAIERFHGYIFVHSDFGEGTTFEIFLPVCKGYLKCN